MIQLFKSIPHNNQGCLYTYQSRGHSKSQPSRTQVELTIISFDKNSFDIIVDELRFETKAEINIKSYDRDKEDISGFGE